MQSVSRGCVLVVDDNPFNRHGLALYLRSVGYQTIEAGDELTALALAQASEPIGAIVDIVIPTCPGAEAQLSASVGINLVRSLKMLNPTMGIVVFSAYDDRGSDVWSLVREGRRGLAYMLKGTRPERLLTALEQSVAGNVVLDPNALTNTRHLGDEIRQQLSSEERPWVQRAADLLPTLTDREMEVARRLANSQNLNGIVESLGIARATVENHVTNLYTKLQLSSVEHEAPGLRKSTLLAKAFMLYELSKFGNGQP